MKKLCLIVAAVLALTGVNAVPKPDFGTTGVISAKSPVITLATATGTQFADVKSETATITSGYAKLTTVYNAMYGMANKIYTKGNELSVAIIALANSNTNYVSMFAAVNTACDNLSTMLTSGISSERAVISSNLGGNYVNNQLNIQIPKIVNDLTALKSSMTAMKNAVQQAVTASGGPNTANIRRFVTAAITNKVQADIGQVNIDIPALAYTIKTVIKNIRTSDAFYKSISPQTTTVVNSVSGEMDSYEFDLGIPDYRADVTALDTDINTDLTDYPLSALQAISTYGDKMGPAFTNIQTILPYATVVNPTISGFFSSYLANIENYLLVDINLNVFFQTSTLPLVTKIIQVLINSGGHAEFCYNKFNPLINKLFLVDLYNISECLRVELTRFETLKAAFESIIALILFDYDNVVEYMNGCLATGGAVGCVAGVGAYYSDLGPYVVIKKGKLTQVIHLETDASLQRLKACFTVANHNMEFQVDDMITDVAYCETNGAN